MALTIRHKNSTRPPWILIGVCCLLSAPSDLHAQESLRLDYQRLEGAATACPDAAGFRGAVAARMGRDPFDPAGSALVSVTLGPSADGWRAQLSIEREGAMGVERTLHSEDGACDELVLALALATSIALENWTPAAAEPEPEVPVCPAPDRPPAPSCPACPTCPACPRPATSEVAFRVGAGALTAFGVSPQPVVVGAQVEVGLRWRDLSTSLAGRLEVPSWRGAVSTSRLVASLRPCGHIAPFVGCGVLSFGALRSEHEPTGERRAAFVAAVGLRPGVELDVYGPLRVALHATLDVPLVRTTVYVDGAEIWRTPVVEGSAGATAVAEF